LLLLVTYYLQKSYLATRLHDMSGSALIEVRDLHVSFGDKKILQGIDIDVLEGETLVLLGGSGSGKSVLTKHMSGLMQSEYGSVKFEGNEISGENRKTR